MNSSFFSGNQLKLTSIFYYFYSHFIYDLLINQMVQFIYLVKH